MKAQRDNSNPTVLVTGGAGYLGSVLSAKLLQNSFDVRVLDYLHWGDTALQGLGGRVDLVEGDVRKPPPGLFDGVEAVVHLAGLSNDPTADFDPAANWQINAMATKELAQEALAAGVRRFVFASSCSVYDGNGDPLLSEEAAVSPVGAYSESKLWAEGAIGDLIPDGLEPVILRFGTLHGWSPRMRYDLIVNTLVKDALLVGKLTIHGDGSQYRPVVHLTDAADAAIAAVAGSSEDLSGKIVNVLEANYSIAELAKKVQTVFAKKGVDIEVVMTEDPTRGRNYRCSNERLKTTLGIHPKVTPEETIDEIFRAVETDQPADLDHPRYYNIKWLDATGAGILELPAKP